MSSSKAEDSIGGLGSCLKVLRPLHFHLLRETVFSDASQMQKEQPNRA